MKTISLAAAIVSISLSCGAPLVARADGTVNGVQHGTGAMKARCSPGDPNVLVNKKTKTYTLDRSAPAPMKASQHMSAASTAGMDMGSASSAGGTNVVSMCQSEAQSMGAKKASGKVAGQ